MRKRPLCAICILFLVIQAVRVCFFGVGEETSALERALAGNAGNTPEEKSGSENTGNIQDENSVDVSDEDMRVTLEGTVYRIEEKAKVTAVCVKNNAVSASRQKFNESKLMVYIRPDQTKIKIGNQIKISGEASVFQTARNPGNFDQRAYYVRQGIHVLVWAEHVEIISDKTDQVQQFLYELRSGWQEVLTERLGEYYGGTMSAVLLGDKSGLDAEMKKLYQKNGIGHLLAISGLHMSFIGMGIYSLLRRIGLGFIPAGAAGSVILILYTVMIGAGVSAFRALIMFLVRVGADMTGRDYDLATSLALAAAVLCWQQPLYVTDAGFLLSFGAILGLVLLSPVFAEMFKAAAPETGRSGKKIPAARRWVVSGLVSSLAVNTLLLGPVLYFYFEIPPYSVFLNLLVIPVMPVAMGAGIAGSVLTILSDTLGSAVLKLCEAVLRLYDGLCSAAGMLPGSRFVTGQPDIALLAAYYVILASLCGLFYFLRFKKEEGSPGASSRSGRDIVIRLPGCALVLWAVLIAVISRSECRNTGGVQVAVLDVGQGDSIHIRGRTGNYLIDGGSSDVSSAGIYRIEPYLLANAVDTLDYVFATHGDEDHVNGIQELLEAQDLGVRIRCLVLPPEEYHDEKLRELARTAQENGTRVAVMYAGDKITEHPGEQSVAPEDTEKEKNPERERLVLKCLGPEKGQGLEPGNGASLVLGMSYGEFRMLFAGDVEGGGERALYENNRLGRYDVLKAAHHGSRNSGKQEFLEVAQPSVALISAGVDNRYGHPHAETLERLEVTGCSVYSTQENGTLTVWTDGEIMKLKGLLTTGVCK